MISRFSRAGFLASLPLLGLAAAAPAHSQEVEWERVLRGDMRGVLSNHYDRQMNSDARSVACLAEKGDTCFGGDHWDRRCMRVVPCRSTAAIRQFIAELERVGMRRIDDPMVVAHAVYGLVRQGQLAPAVEIAEKCEAVAWWCDLVLGMVHHRSGGSAEAGMHYRSGLARGTPDLVCLLTDITQLVEGRDEDTYKRLPCPGPERSEFEERFWWLSDPFLTKPGNDRWTEHVTRRFELVLDGRLGGRAANDPQHIEEVTRRGQPDSWMQRSRRLEFWRSEEGARYRFTAASLVGDGVQALRYELRANRWDEGYTPTEYGPVFEVPGQIARFLEGDSLVLAVAADLDAAPFHPEDIRFVAEGGVNGASASLEGAAGDQSPSFTLKVAAVPLVVAIEAFGDRSEAARLRQGVLPLATDGVALSDVLMLDPRLSELPADREEAAESMLPQTWIGNAGELAVYWEIYGIEADEMVQITVALETGGAGLLTRVLRTLGGRAGTPATAVSWAEPVSGSTHPMAITVDVDRLEPGDYDLQIDIMGPDGSTATTIRRVRLGRR